MAALFWYNVTRRLFCANYVIYLWPFKCRQWLWRCTYWKIPLCTSRKNNLAKIISYSFNKSLCLDHTPTSIRKLCLDELTPVLTLFVNHFLELTISPQILRKPSNVRKFRKFISHPYLDSCSKLLISCNGVNLCLYAIFSCYVPWDW